MALEGVDIEGEAAHEMGRVSEGSGQLAVDCNTTCFETIYCGTLLSLSFRYRDTPYCSFGTLWSTHCSRSYNFPCLFSCFEGWQSITFIKQKFFKIHRYRKILSYSQQTNISSCCASTHKNVSTSKLFVGTTFWKKVCLKPSCLDCGTVSLTNCVG